MCPSLHVGCIAVSQSWLQQGRCQSLMRPRLLVGNGRGCQLPNASFALNNSHRPSQSSKDGTVSSEGSSQAFMEVPRWEEIQQGTEPWNPRVLPRREEPDPSNHLQICQDQDERHGRMIGSSGILLVSPCSCSPEEHFMSSREK